MESRTKELLESLGPGPPSLERRRKVLGLVRKIVEGAFKKKDRNVYAFTFGSVPMKTCLPDGDIDVCIFAQGKPLPERWISVLREELFVARKGYGEEMNIRGVSSINAEVKLCKCYIDNLLVDFSVGQLSGLGTLLFLEEVNLMVGKDELVKKSFLLSKAWCFYESRILGAQHSLLSTYALEIMVLYVIVHHHQEARTPLKVLLLFLKHFSTFDWEKIYLTLEGTRWKETGAICSDENEESSLLSKAYLDRALRMYCPMPEALESGKDMGMKFMNVADPLLPSNNLGRSVSQASFCRIRKALARGAKELEYIFALPEEESVHALESFFGNTLSRLAKVMDKEETMVDWEEEDWRDQGLFVEELQSCTDLRGAEDEPPSHSHDVHGTEKGRTAEEGPSQGSKLSAVEIARAKWNIARECLNMSVLKTTCSDRERDQDRSQGTRPKEQEVTSPSSTSAEGPIGNRSSATKEAHVSLRANGSSSIRQQPSIEDLKEFPPLGL